MKKSKKIKNYKNPPCGYCHEDHQGATLLCQHMIKSIIKKIKKNG